MRYIFKILLEIDNVDIIIYKIFYQNEKFSV